MTIDAHIGDAIKCGPIPKLRNWRIMREENLTMGEKVCRFAETYLRVPDGLKVGQPLVLDTFQVAYILAVIDNPHGTRTGILSMARRNSKSTLVAVLLLAYLVGPLTRENQTIASAANSRDQAALIFRLMTLMCQHSDDIRERVHIVPSGKKITCIKNGATYQALSADAKTGYGQSLRVVVLDESGQIVGPTTPFVEMLTTSQGSYSDSVFLTISTQAPSDADYLSVMIDDAIRSKDPHTVCHVYEADADCDLLDEKQWLKANPALGNFRSKEDLRTSLEKAQRLAALESSARNLLLNQRVARDSLWLGASSWRACGGAPDLDVFREGMAVCVGIDLSTRTDLTAAVFACRDAAGFIHLVPHCFAPAIGVEQRELRDRYPYRQRAAEGHLQLTPGATVDYEWVCQYLAKWCADENIEITNVEFDRWRIEDFKREAERNGFASFAEWKGVGQGYRDMSPRIETFEGLLLGGKLLHGSHPMLNMAASNAIVISDPANNRKLEKAKSTQRIDPLVAAVMATYTVAVEDAPSDPADWIMV